MEDVNVLWVARGKEFPFQQWGDLVGKKGTALLGESYGQGLAMGRSDYYPFSLHGGMIQIKQMDLESRITYLEKPISAESIYIAISKKSKFLPYLPRIEAAIQARRADGTVDRLIRKHTH
jgi:polar amino acid transport system substrate-binding protein